MKDSQPSMILIYRHVNPANGEFVQDSILSNYMGYQFNTTKFTSSTYLNKKVWKKGCS